MTTQTRTRPGRAARQTTPQQWAKAQARHAAERSRLTARPNETVTNYIRRMHRTDTGHLDATRSRQRYAGACNCPRAYSLCKYAMYWRAQHGADRATTLHGGWGWPSYWDEQGNPIPIPDSAFR
jgi:hypothetical protein